MGENLVRKIQRLAAATGGVTALAARCHVDESKIWRWLSGDAIPSRDEKFVLELIARREGLDRESSPPPLAPLRDDDEEPDPSSSSSEA